jgi:type I restriction enzyme S subunit
VSTQPAAIPRVPFEKAAVTQTDRGKRVKQRDYLTEGRIPVIDQGQSQVGGYTNDEDFAFIGELPVVLFGDHTRAVKLVDRRFAVGADGIKIFRPSEGVRAKYLYYWMKSAPLPDRGYGRHYQYLRLLSLPLPSPKQQDEIVAELEKQFSRLDQAVANLKRAKANLKRYKAAVLVDAVEGALAGDRTGWTALRLGDVASSVRNGISTKPVGESGTRILRISAVRPMTLDLSDVRYLAQPLDEFEALQLAAGDVLFTRYNGSVDLVGVCAVVAELPEPTVYPDKLIRVRVPSEVLLPSFLVIAASTGEARAFIGSRIRTTAGQAGVSGADIKGIPLRVPPLAEQLRIVAEVDRRLSAGRELEAELDANLLRADALLRTTLADSFALSN